MRKFGTWLLQLFFCAVLGLLVYGAAKIHWGLGLAVGLILWHLLVERPLGKVEEQLRDALYREWQLSCSFLWALGWANTLGEKGNREKGELDLPPRMSTEPDNAFDRWWYQPEGIRGSYVEKDSRRGDVRAMADFSRMTVTTIDSERTLNFELRSEGDDPLSSELRARLLSKAPLGGATEFVDVANWIHAWPHGIDIAYRLFLRQQKRARVQREAARPRPKAPTALDVGG